MGYFVIQDRNVGFIQYVTEAPDEDAALRAFDDEVGIDPHGEGLDPSQWRFTEVSRDQFEHLKECAGDDQAAIDLVEAIKRCGPELRYKLVDRIGNSPPERWGDVGEAISAAEGQPLDVFVDFSEESVCVWLNPARRPS